MNYGWEVSKIIFYLIIVITIIYILAHYLKKLYLRPNSGENMEVLEQLYLDSKKSLKLVKINNKIMLLGVSENNIELLAEWPEADFVINRKTDEANENFANKFKKVLAKYRRDDNE